MNVGVGFNVVVAIGLVGAAGAWTVWTGWRPQIEPLARVLARLGQGQVAEPSARGDLDDRFGALVRRVPVVQRTLDELRADLAIMDRGPNDQAARIGAWALLGLWAGPLALMARWLIGIPIPMVLAGWISIAGAIGGAVLPVVDLREQAAKRRKAYLRALAAYCVSVDMSLHIGAGPEQALSTAAADGQGWQFTFIRAALAAAAARNEEPWAALTRLGERIGVPDLVELAKTIEHVALRGAAVGDTVAGIADSIQGRIAADTERDAIRATVRMAIPATMLLLGFMVLLAYPAAVSVLDTF